MYQEEIKLAKSLFAKQLEYAAEHGRQTEMAYVLSKFAMEITIQRQLRIIAMFCPWIKGRVLDWGCHHGLDSCILRKRYGNALDLYGCDWHEDGTFRPFQQFSGAKYKQFRHEFLLDYDDAFFDVVLSDGVLEHVPDDRKSLQEIYRILKPGGHFLLTCLPNRWSYTEAIGRVFNIPHHDRLYTIPGASRMLREAGFQVLTTRRFFMLPTMLTGMPPRIKRAYERGSRVFWVVNDVLERVWPVNRVCSNLMLNARKP